MSDDIKLEEVKKPEESPAPKETSPEEWKTLDGRSQDRFKKMASLKNDALKRADEAEREVDRLKTQPKIVPMPQSTTNPTQEELAAINRLKQLNNELGFVTKDELKESEEKRESIRAREQLDDKHKNLKGHYDKRYKSKAPLYDEREIEDAMYKTGIYDPEYHYEKIYKEELRELDFKKLKSKKSEDPTPTQTKSKIAAGQPWTPEALQERLQQPDGQEFYKKNQDKINKLYNEWGGR